MASVTLAWIDDIKDDIKCFQYTEKLIPICAPSCHAYVRHVAKTLNGAGRSWPRHMHSISKPGQFSDNDSRASLAVAAELKNGWSAQAKASIGVVLPAVDSYRGGQAGVN